MEEQIHIGTNFGLKLSPLGIANALIHKSIPIEQIPTDEATKELIKALLSIIEGNGETINLLLKQRNKQANLATKYRNNLYKVMQYAMKEYHNALDYSGE